MALLSAITNLGTPRIENQSRRGHPGWPGFECPEFSQSRLHSKEFVLTLKQRIGIAHGIRKTRGTLREELD